MSNLSLRRPIEETGIPKVNNSFTITRPALSPLTPIVSTPRVSPVPLRTPQSNVRVTPISHRIPTPQSSVRSFEGMSSPGSRIPTPQILSPQSIRVQSPMVLNPTSPISIQPVLVNGEIYNPDLLTPIVRRPPTVARTVTLTPREQIPIPPPKQVKKKRTTVKSKPQSWDDMKKNYQVPEYGILSEEQKRMLRVDFHNRFNMIANQCPNLDVINYAANNEMSLEEVHVAYVKLLDRISTSSTADWYKTMLVLSWLGTEYAVTKWLGLKSGGYAFFQSRNMSKYDRILMQLGEVDRNKGFASWSPMTQLIMGSLINLVIFVVVQTFMENMPQDKKDGICNAVGSFFTSTGNEQPNLMGAIPGVLQGNPGDIASAGSSFISGGGGGAGGLIGSLLGGFMGGGQQQAPTTTTNTETSGGRRRRTIVD